MGKNKGDRSPPRSRSPRAQPAQTERHIPELFRSRSRDIQADSQASQAAPAAQAAQATQAPQTAQAAQAPQASQAPPALQGSVAARSPQAPQISQPPQASQAAPAPQASKAAPAPQASQAAPAPQASQAAPAPQASKTAPAPQASRTAPAPQASQAAPAPQAPQAAPVIQSQQDDPSAQASYSFMRPGNHSTYRETYSTDTQATEAMRPAKVNHNLTLHDLQSVATDIKKTLSAAIADLRLDFQGIVNRLEEVEEETVRHDHAIMHNTHTLDSHTLHLRDMRRHLEDLENRGRRHNLRIRGLPESIEQPHLLQAILTIFNELLERPADIPIEMERFHRALRPKGKENEPPRDVICHIFVFQLKEEILRNARTRGRITFRGTEIKIFQDLSQITLQQRRDLRPLLTCLREHDIPYRWKFPFCLSAGPPNRPTMLRVPEELPSFCERLNIPLVDLPNWYDDLRPSRRPPDDPMELQLQLDQSSQRRRREPKRDSTPPANRRSPGGGSVPASPAHRKQRKD